MGADLLNFTPKHTPQAGELTTLCRQYLAHLRTLGRRPNTLVAYQRDLEQLCGYALQMDVRFIQHVNTPLLEDRLQALALGRGNSQRTVARKLETARGLLRFALRRGVIRKDPADGLTVQFNTTRVIAPEEEQLLYVIASIPSDSLINIRDRALFRLMFDAALRVDGIASLDLYRADAPPACCVQPNGVVTYRAKGGDTKSTVCGQQTLDTLAEWLAVRHEAKGASLSPALFLTGQGHRVNRAALHARIKQHGARAGLPHIHCHLFRHRRIGDVIERTGDLRLAADMAGHADVRTTANIYGHHAAERMRQRIREHAPLGGMA